MASPLDPPGNQPQKQVPAASSQTSPSTPESTLRGRLRPFFWPLVCLFQVGIILGWIYLSLRGTGESDGTSAEPLGALPHFPKTEGAVSTEGQVSLSRGDDWLQEGRFPQALALYQQLRPQAAPPLAVRLEYRLGLCLEGVGKLEEALSAYRAMAEKQTSGALAAAAQLGQARVTLQIGRHAEARKLLYDLLRTPLPSGGPEPLFLPDARFYLGLAWLAEVGPRETPSPLNEAVLPTGPIDWHLEQALDWENSKLPAPQLGPPMGELWAIHKVGDHPQENLVRAALPPTAVASLVERLAKHCGWPTQWTTLARQQCHQRQVPLIVENRAVQDLLTSLLDPLEIVWQVDKGVLQLLAAKEADRELLKQYRFRAGWRALREAMLANPGHPLAFLARQELGNLEAALGKPAEAAKWYLQVVKTGPRSPLIYQANYNLGLLLARNGDTAAARTAFYRVVDLGSGSELTALAYLRIGRTFLEEGQPELAQLPLRRSVGLSQGSSTQPAAVVTLAAAQLLAGQLQEARSTLTVARKPVGHPPYRQTAALLDALARFRLAENRVQSQREANDLFAALAALTKEAVLGTSGKLLIAHAYKELGLDKSMLIVLEKTLPTTQGPLAEELTYLMAEALLPTPRRLEAVKLFDALATHPGSKWAPPAKFNLAEIALQEDKPLECLTWCRAMWRGPGSVNRARILHLMGRAYERLGQPRQATLCFAGQAPEEEPATAQPPIKKEKQ